MDQHSSHLLRQVVLALGERNPLRYTASILKRTAIPFLSVNLSLAISIGAAFLVTGAALGQPETTNPLAGDPAAIREGSSLFRANCSPCHGLNAGGWRAWAEPSFRSLDPWRKRRGNLSNH